MDRTSTEPNGLQRTVIIGQPVDGKLPRPFGSTIIKTVEQARRQDVVTKRIESGKPLPLEIILKTMDFFDQKASEAIESYNEQQSEQNRFEMLDYLERVEKSAFQAAKYFHPQLANVQVTGENGGPIKHAHAHVLLNDLRGKSDDDLARSYAELLMGREAAADAQG